MSSIEEVRLVRKRGGPGQFHPETSVSAMMGAMTRWQRFVARPVTAFVSALATIGGALALIVWLHKGVADQWHRGYPLLQMWTLVGLTVIGAAVTSIVVRKRRKRVEADHGRQLAELEDRHQLQLAAVDASHRQQSSAMAARIAELEELPVQADVDLFTKFMTLMHSDSSGVCFLRDHVFDLTYNDNDWKNVRSYYGAWATAEYEFHDHVVQQAQHAFRDGLGNFCEHLYTHSFSRGSGLYRIYPDYDLDLDDGTNSFAIEAARTANELSLKAWELHQEFVRVARKRLRV